MPEKIAKVISILFHPVLIPTYGFLILLNSGFYFSMISWEAKKYVLMVVFITTTILPVLSVAILALNPKFDVSMQYSRDRVIPLLSASVFYYLGYMLLNKMQSFPAFKLFFLASVLLVIALLLISFKWKISNHMAAVGGLSATLFALSFRSGLNPVYAIVGVVLVSGLVGSARLILQKHNLWQVATGYALGFSVLYVVVYFL